MISVKNESDSIFINIGEFIDKIKSEIITESSFIISINFLFFKFI